MFRYFVEHIGRDVFEGEFLEDLLSPLADIPTSRKDECEGSDGFWHHSDRHFIAETCTNVITYFLEKMVTFFIPSISHGLACHPAIAVIVGRTDMLSSQKVKIFKSL